MSESLSAAAFFLNLDLELEASSDLAFIAERFSQRAHVLYCGEVPGGYRLSVEPVIDGALSNDPVACTEYFLGLLEGLPQDCVALLQKCSSRVFDYGFDGGLEANPYHTSISSKHLARMANLGIEFRVTIYPFRAHTDDE